jgi:hypothetical protein
MYLQQGHLHIPLILDPRSALNIMHFPFYVYKDWAYIYLGVGCIPAAFPSKMEYSKNKIMPSQQHDIIIIGN